MSRKRWSIIALVVLLVSLMPQLAAAQTPNYYTSVIVSDVTSGAAVDGGTFTTNVSISVTNSSTPQLGVMGAEIWIGFDDTILAVDDADDNPANGTQVSISTEFFGGPVFVAKNEVIPCSYGSCVHIAVSHAGDPITNRTGRIATITWAGQAVGAAGLVVGTTAPELTVLADEDGNDVPINSTSVPAISVVAPGTIDGQVLRQGTRIDHANTAVTAYNTSGGVVGSAFTDPSGAFSLTVPLGGTYLVQATYNGYVKAQKSSVYVVGAVVDLGTTTIIGGDVNGDNNVNILDVVTIISRFGNPSTGLDDPVDINDDGTVNIFDLTICAGNFGRYGPLGW